ncbi:GEVED domain-containing protein [Kaistella faecalis]|uniref:GEVED domain-containing protein n=1 Tax=Kaistella faecalis TaxID=2852098 RepID=UPI001C459778|nr:GEVED domain-containing protein [Chryseobacterium faecale]UFK97568.1 T9SS type A sorting domain-containing protein [Chryseobacterium faecale]
MKKLLLSCFLAMGIGAQAQLNYTGDFEDATNVGQYGQFGGGTFETAAACSGTLGGQLAIGGTVSQTGWMVMNDVLEEEFGSVNNGQEAVVTFSYKKAAGVTGTLYAAVFTFVPSSGAWNIEYVSTGTVLGTAAITTCAQKTGTIPAGKMQPGQSYAFGAWFVPSGGTSGNVFIDNISIAQQSVTTVPACTAFTNPVNGGVLPSGTNTFTWPAVATAVNYVLTVGTTPGGNDTFGGVVAGTSQNVALAPNTTYYATVTPANTVGEATGCTGVTFTTNNVITYCGPLTSSAPTAVAPIKSVNFAGTTKTSDAAATTIGSFAAYEDFTTTVFEVKDNVTSLPLTVLGTTNGNPVNGWAMSVFIDWNSDGDFDDAGESYFNTTATMIRKANVPDNPTSLTGNIAIPAGTAYGQKRMRVKYNFSGTAIHTALVSGCAQMGNGQAEDYTINYQQFLAVGDVNKSNVSVYPNPFKDVLKISDIKGVKSINIVDVSGRTVKTLAPATELNLGQLKSGMYFVNLQYTDGSVKTVKSIKK